MPVRIDPYLMASPEGARSKWVNREVEWWLENKAPQRLLVVLTEGEFAWAEDEEAGHEDGAAALPPALRSVFAEKPRWVDLRWLHRGIDRLSYATTRACRRTGCATRRSPWTPR